MSTNTPNTPHQVALERLTMLRDKMSKAHIRASALLQTALTDATALYSQGGAVKLPDILSDPGIAELTILRNELGELQNFYDTQLRHLSGVIAANAVEIADRPVVSAEEAMKALKARTEHMAAQRAHAEDNRAETSLTKLYDTAVAEMPASRIGSQVPASDTEQLSVSTAPALPKEEVVTTSGLPAVDSTEPKRPSIPIPENSITRLLGSNSPLLGIFAPSPWLPDGRGLVTVGSEGFQWHKTVDPVQRDPLARAKLPMGFYGGTDHPRYVVIRMQTMLMLWSFDLAPESMELFVVGLSDQDPNNMRWLKVTELSASYTRKLIQELAAIQEKHSPAPQA